MNKYENEEFKVNEFSKFDEYQRFKAEDFRSLELFGVKKEEYKVEEVQKQSFVNEDEPIKQEQGNKDNKVFDKLKNKIMSSSSATSASVSTAIGSTGALITAGVIGAGVVLSPVLDLPIIPEDSNQPSEEPIIIDFGTIDLINYVVDSDGTQKTITIYFDEQINDEYKCYVLNKKTQQNIELNKELDYVTFENLVDEQYDFELIIKDVNDEVVDSKQLVVNTIGSIPYTTSHSYEWLVTYNTDNTFNFYYYPKYNYLNNEIEIEAMLYDSLGKEVKSNSKVVDNVYCFENISDTDFTLDTKAYLIEDSNKYLTHNESIDFASPYTFSYDVTANEQVVNITIDKKLSSDINVTLTYLDDNSVEKYSYPIDTWNGSVDILLTKKTEKVKVDIETTSTYLNSTNVDFIEYIGSLNCSHVVEEELLTNVNSSISLQSVEIFNESFVNDDGKIPTMLTFDGYIIKDAYYKVNVYDMSNQLVAQSDNITLLNKNVVMYDLPTDQELIFEYLVYDKDDNQLFTDSYQTSLEIKEEYLNALDNIQIGYVNPSEVIRTFNDDGTINYYFNNEIINNTSYNVLSRVSLLSENDLINSTSRYTSNGVILFENMPSDQTYGLIFNTAIQDGINIYILDSGIVPSGMVNEDRNENGVYSTYLDINETEIFKHYEVYLDKKAYSDLLVEVSFDTKETLKFTILQSEMVNDTFSLDLSNYEFEYATVDVSVLLDISHVTDELLEKVTTIKGNVYTDVIASATLEINPGYASYLHHNVESKPIYDQNSGEYVIYKDIYIYVNAYTSSFFDTRVVNTNNNTSVILDKELEYVVFKDLLEGTYNFELQIIDSNGKAYDTSQITINTEGNIQYSSQPQYDALITYNEYDNTYNIYYYPKFDYTNNTVETTYILKDQDGNEIERYTNENSGISFSNIANTSFQLEYKSYLIDNDNTYLIASTSTQLFELDNIPYKTNRISANQVSISFENELDSDLQIEVIYKDDNSMETFTIGKDEWAGSTILNLSKLSTDIELSITATLIIYNENIDNNITYHSGSLGKVYTSSETLSFNIDVQVSLESVEILNNTYSIEGTVPTNLIFDGYMKPQQTLSVNVYDSSNTKIDGVEGVSNVNKVVTFSDLTTDEDVTFEYIIYDVDGTSEVYKNTYQTSLAIPSDYTTDGISYTSFNPNDASLTFNKDGTYNAYFITNLENTTTYDVYMRMELVDSLSNEYSVISYGSGSTVLLENINPTNDYTMGYGLVIKDGINYYAINSRGVPSGSVCPTMYEDGAYVIYVIPTETNANVYDFEFTQEITSDITVTIILDETTTETVVIPLSEITNNVVRIDMSPYSYVSASIQLSGKIILQYYEEIESKVDNIIGVNECDFQCTYTI